MVGLGRTSTRLVPVSYTHLDVYKRQRVVKDLKMKGPVGAGIIKNCGIFDAGRADKLIIDGEKKSCLLYTSRCV